MVAMALSVKNPEADQLVRELTAETGETITEAIVVALRERLERVRGRRSDTIRRRLSALQNEVRAYPILDTRSADEIISYDERGLPT
jgi:antitoxin VapB